MMLTVILGVVIAVTLFVEFVVLGLFIGYLFEGTFWE